MSELVKDEPKKNDGLLDNGVAFGAGILQLASVLITPYFMSLFGVGRMATLGFIAAIILIAVFILRKLNTDSRSYMTLGGFSLIALMMFLFLSPSSSAFGANRSTATNFDFILVEVYLDRNQNGVKDGSDESVLGVPIKTRDLYGASQEIVSNSSGLVTFKIPAERKKLQIVACGIAMSHTLSDDEKIPNGNTLNSFESTEHYKVDIGIELSDVANCTG